MSKEQIFNKLIIEMYCYLFQDVLRLDAALPNSVEAYKIEYPKFSHLDFLWANDVVKLLYNDVFDYLSRY